MPSAWILPCLLPSPPCQPIHSVYGRVVGCCSFAVGCCCCPPKTGYWVRGAPATMVRRRQTLPLLQAAACPFLRARAPPSPLLLRLRQCSWQSLVQGAGLLLKRSCRIGWCLHQSTFLPSRSKRSRGEATERIALPCLLRGTAAAGAAGWPATAATMQPACRLEVGSAPRLPPRLPLQQQLKSASSVWFRRCRYRCRCRCRRQCRWFCV